MKEQSIQNQIRAHVSMQKLGVLFRGNVGEAWTGERIVKNVDGSITIHNPRRFKTGLPIGFSDLFGVTDNGRTVFIEVKAPKGRLRPEQKNFLMEMVKRGAFAGVARSPEDAERIFGGTLVGLE